MMRSSWTNKTKCGLRSSLFALGKPQQPPPCLLPDGTLRPLLPTLHFARSQKDERFLAHSPGGTEPKSLARPRGLLVYGMAARAKKQNYQHTRPGVFFCFRETRLPCLFHVCENTERFEPQARLSSPRPKRSQRSPAFSKAPVSGP